MTSKKYFIFSVFVGILLAINILNFVVFVPRAGILGDVTLIFDIFLLFVFPLLSFYGIWKFLKNRKAEEGKLLIYSLLINIVGIVIFILFLRWSLYLLAGGGPVAQ